MQSIKSSYRCLENKEEKNSINSLRDMVKYIAREDSPLYEKISDLYKTS